MIIIKTLIAVATLLCCLFGTDRLYAQLRLPAFVTDSMIIQRDTKLKIWGWASKGEKITVNFRGKNFRTAAGSDGKWFVTIPPVKAGGPYDMNISASNKITLKNILVGDVWVCAGQSNMVHYLNLHKDRYTEDIAQANYPEIRQFLIPTLTNLQQAAEDLPKVRWKSATPENVLRFSVVAYFFAKKLYDKYHVPIGIINASVGGPPIEAWISEEGFKEFPDVLKTVEKNKDTSYVNNIVRLAREKSRERAKIKQYDRGLEEEKKWYDPAYVPKSWHAINIPGYWEDQGVKDLNGFVWYRKEIDVPVTMTGVPAKIELGRIIDADFLYVNGVLVGNTTYQYPQRRYQIAAGLLKPGKNILTIRVRNDYGKGGFMPDKPYYLSAGDRVIDLKGTWQYKVGEVFNNEPFNGGGMSFQDQPTALYNAMIAPLTNYAIKGICWYQGESNTGKPKAYRELLRTLIADWRGKWRQGDIPFLFVQLPNFMDVNYHPSESEWAETRESQRQTLKIPNTGMAVAIDLGHWNELHPGNKKPIGERLALVAEKVAYGDSTVVYSGPTYTFSIIEGNKIILTFGNVGSGLVSIDGEELSQFAIAGDDKKFVWAKASIVGNTVIVWSDEISKPLYVRYAWADNPRGANLYNKEELPASPFTTEK